MIWDVRAKLATAAGIVVLIYGLGVGTGWKLFHPVPGKIDPPAASVVQNDGSVILERRPDANAKPVQTIPHGATVNRIDHIVLQPTAATSAYGAGTAPTAGSGQPVGAPPAPSSPCPPVRLDLTLVTLPDKTMRVIASSPDGTVLEGSSVDIPVTAQEVPKVLRWSTGASYHPRGGAWGLWLGRDGEIPLLHVPVTGSIEVSQVKVLGLATSYETSLRAGIRF